MSYKAEVIADDSDQWSDNLLRFADDWEAVAYVKDLERRSTRCPRDVRVLPSDDPVNARWVDGRLEHVAAATPE